MGRPRMRAILTIQVFMYGHQPIIASMPKLTFTTNAEEVRPPPLLRLVIFSHR